MKIRVLGSAAGGGFPQWNCNCFNCKGLREGAICASARTQSSLAVSDGGQDWLLLNTSPDILQQIRANPVLQPARTLRDSGICGVLLMDAQIDHVTGLLMLRERGSPLPLYATSQVFAELSDSLPLVRVLGYYCGVERHTIVPDGEAFAVAAPAGLRFRAIALESKAPPYSAHRNDPHPGDNIGLSMTDARSGASAFYAPGLGSITAPVRAAMQAADVVLVDGTFWTEDEMVEQGLSAKPALAMGHLPVSGTGGMIELLDSLPARRKILIHINNSNPMLRDDSAERALLQRHGIEVAYDGMEIDL